MKVQSTTDKRLEEQATALRLEQSGRAGLEMWNGHVEMDNIDSTPRFLCFHLSFCASYLSVLLHTENMWPFIEDCPRATGGHFAHMKRDRSIWDIYSPHPPTCTLRAVFTQ